MILFFLISRAHKLFKAEKFGLNETCKDWYEHCYKKQRSLFRPSYLVEDLECFCVYGKDT